MSTTFIFRFLTDDGSSRFHPTLLKPEGGAGPQLIDKSQALLTVKRIQEDKESLKKPSTEQPLQLQILSNATVGGMKIQMQKYFEKLWRTNVTFWFCALKIHISATCIC